MGAPGTPGGLETWPGQTVPVSGAPWPDIVQARAGAVAFYALDQADGAAKTADLIGGHDGTFVGTPTGEHILPPQYTSTAFPTSADGMQAPWQANTLGHVTVEVWFKPTATLPPSGHYALIAGFQDSAGRSSAELYQQSDGKIGWHIRDATGDAYLTTTAGLRTDHWYHLVGTHNGTTVKLFINAVQHPSTTGMASSITSFGADGYFCIGAPKYTGTDLIADRGAVGTYDAVAVYSEALSANDIFVNFEYNRGALPSPPFLTQLAVEVARTANPAALLTSIVLEVPRTANPGGRVTSLCVEVLRATADGHECFATTGIEFGHHGNRVTIDVAATHTIEFAHEGSETAASSIYFVGATHTIEFAHTAPHPTFVRPVAATTVVNFRSVGGGRNVTIFVDATTGIKFHHQGFSPRTWIVSALSKFLVIDHANDKDNPVFVAAVTGIEFACIGLGPVAAIRAVSATTGVEFVSVAPAPGGSRVYHVGATATIRIGHRGSIQSKVMVVQATSIVELGSAARSGREFHRFAVTGLEFAEPALSNQFYAKAGTTGLELAHQALKSIGYHDARSTFCFFHRAYASVGLPWRPAGITLPPGGGLPHS